MSVLLDTNVVSELIRKARDPGVAAWVASLPLEELFFSAVGEAEMRYGAAILPVGRRREKVLREPCARQAPSTFQPVLALPPPTSDQESIAGQLARLEGARAG